MDDLAVWREWEQASTGRQQLTWSKGIRSMAGLAEQQRGDDDIVDIDLGTDDLLILDRDTRHAVAPVQIELLEAAARAGVAGAVAWLDQAGLAYVVTSAGIDLLKRSPWHVWKSPFAGRSAGALVRQTVPDLRLRDLAQSTLSPNRPTATPAA